MTVYTSTVEILLSNTCNTISIEKETSQQDKSKLSSI